MRHRLNCDFRRYLATRQDPIENFKTDEDGSLSIMSLFLVPMMLILGGMAVDYMRFESERALVQDTADRAALAAANLEFTNTGEGPARVNDFFAKAGLDQYLDGAPIVTENINNRTVEVNVNRPMNTNFLNWVGIDELEAPAKSVATQGVGNVEISLVLDISGSMGNPTYDANGAATGETKMEALKTAATTFVNTALQDANKDRVSLSLVPYSQHVNAGPNLMNAMRVDKVHDYTHCVNFEDVDFRTAGLNLSKSYEQGQYWDHWSGGPTLLSPTCPSRDYEEITAVSQDRAAIISQISQLQPRTMTSIFLGMKWGVALLDPSTRPLVEDTVDGAFAGRPADYKAVDAENKTTKVLVVMTDGQNTEFLDLKDEYYDDPSAVAHWAQNPLYYWYNNNRMSGSISDYTTVVYDHEKGNRLLADSCNAARKKNIQVFAIAFEAGSAGETAMSNCATSVNHYFNTNGDDLNAVFRAIAEQVTDLRLTQ